MRLSTARAQQAIDQMEGQGEFQQTVAIPDDSPVVPTLTTLVWRAYVLPQSRRIAYRRTA